MYGTRTLGALVCLSFLGCANPYDYYEDSLYSALRVPKQEVYTEHAELLGEIVEYYQERDQKPPPGILAEYGFYLARVGRTEEAKRYFAAERQVYPESAVFMTVLERTINGGRPFTRESTETGGGAGGP